MEACATAHYWARELAKLGHTVRLMPPAYVKPYVKRGKTDAADAEAIAEAVTRPTMRFVAVKTAEQQAILMLHKVRDLLIRQRTMLINALRGHLAEFGIIAAYGGNCRASRGAGRPAHVGQGGAAWPCRSAAHRPRRGRQGGEAYPGASPRRRCQSAARDNPRYRSDHGERNRRRRARRHAFQIRSPVRGLARPGWYEAGRNCTTRRGNAHRTDIAEKLEVLYPWHPWAGCIVRVHETIEKVGGTVLRCSRDGQARERWLELPVWMFDRSACLAMWIARDPRVGFAALAELRELLAEAAAQNGQSSPSKTPVSGAASEARDQNRGNAHVTPKSPSCDRTQTIPAARPVRPCRSRRATIDRSRRGVPPEETRRAVMELMVRLLLDHGRVDHRPIRTEAIDDV
jgi:Transposase